MNRKVGLVCVITMCLCMMLAVFQTGSTVYADGSYHVTFNFNTSRISEYMPDSILQNFQSIQEVEVLAGGYASPATNPSSEIYNYYTLEWTQSGNVVDISNYPINSNVIFIAKWTPKLYRITYVFSSEQVKSEITNLKETEYYTVESPRINYYIPNRPNYYFVDWYASSLYKNNEKELYRPPKSIGDKYIYACFRPIDYFIDYHTNASNLHNPETYNVDMENIELVDIEQEGHIFQGWYSDASLTTPITTIDTSIGGDIDIYPKWELVKYKVTYIMPDGSKERIYCEYGKTAELPKINKSIFEVVTTDVSRNNIQGNTTIKIKLVNIWYVYVLGILLLGGGTVGIIFAIKRRNLKVNRLRFVYQSKANKRR